jgi:hypothetical protein
MIASCKHYYNKKKQKDMDKSTYPGVNSTTFTASLDSSWYNPVDWSIDAWYTSSLKKRTVKSMTNSGTKKREKKRQKGWSTGVWITDPTKSNMFTLTNSVCTGI